MTHYTTATGFQIPKECIEVNCVKVDYWFEEDGSFKTFAKDIIEAGGGREDIFTLVLPNRAEFDSFNVPLEWLQENVRRVWAMIPSTKSGFVFFFEDSADALAFRMTF